MSRFYGSVQGNRGAATRGGSAASGFKASAQSYDGSVIVELFEDKEGKVVVDIGLNNGSSSYVTEPLFRGSFDELREKLTGKKKGD